MKGLRRNKKSDVVTFDMESKLCGRVRIWRTGVRSGTMDGHGLHCKLKLASSVVLCGLERSWLVGQGELGVAASSRVPETVELATSEQRARPPAALGLVRLPVSVRTARQCRRLEPMRPRRAKGGKCHRLSFYVRLAQHEPCGHSLAARAFPICIQHSDIAQDKHSGRSTHWQSA